MRTRLLAGIAGAALFLAGCGGGGEDDGAATITDSPTVPASTSSADAGGDNQAAGDVDCSVFAAADIAKFAVWTQLFAQVRTVDALQSMSTLGYTPEAMGAILDDLDQLKGHSGEVFGTPDDALVVFRSANDTYAAIIAKGEAATDADFAPLDALEPDVASWINAQATVTDALNQACPDLAG
jgi:hypothetical protein